MQEAANANQDEESVAKAYLDYFNRYRSSSLGDKALYYAALAYEKAERTAAAEKVKLRLIKLFPQSELARETLFAMAAKYENAVEIKKSRKLFQHFAKLYVKDERTPLALLKVAKFSMALGDVAQAQTAYRKVGADYVEHPQAHLAAIQACEPLEKEIKGYREDGFNPPKRRAELLDQCYASWLSQKAYRTRNADLRCYVLTRRAQLYGGVLNQSARAKGFHKDADVVWDSISNNIAAERRRCSDVRAEINFRKLESDFEKFARLSLSPLDPSSSKAIALFQASLAVVTERRDELLRRYQQIRLWARKPEFASAYRAGEVLAQSVEKLLKAPIAKSLDLSEEDEEMVRDGLRESCALRALALSRFEDCLESLDLAVGGSSREAPPWGG